MILLEDIAYASRESQAYGISADGMVAVGGIPG
jgi:hypothetical protein